MVLLIVNCENEPWIKNAIWWYDMNVTCNYCMIVALPLPECPASDQVVQRTVRSGSCKRAPDLQTHASRPDAERHMLLFKARSFLSFLLCDYIDTASSEVMVMVLTVLITNKASCSKPSSFLQCFCMTSQPPSVLRSSWEMWANPDGGCESWFDHGKYNIVWCLLYAFLHIASSEIDCWQATKELVSKNEQNKNNLLVMIKKSEILHYWKWQKWVQILLFEYKSWKTVSSYRHHHIFQDPGSGSTMKWKVTLNDCNREWLLLLLLNLL